MHGGIDTLYGHGNIYIFFISLDIIMLHYLGTTRVLLLRGM